MMVERGVGMLMMRQCGYDAVWYEYDGVWDDLIGGWLALNERPRFDLPPNGDNKGDII